MFDNKIPAEVTDVMSKIPPEVVAKMTEIMCDKCPQKNECDHPGNPHWVKLAVEEPSATDEKGTLEK